MTVLKPIMIVDDNHEDLFILKRLLTRAGVKNGFVSFDHAEEAMRFLEAAMRVPETNLIPAAIFSDKRMPRHDGFAFLKWVRQQSALARLPFFLLTSAAEPTDEELAVKLGVTRFMEKYPSEHVFSEIFGTQRDKFHS
jgi:CheY-like chemotaxis protein